MSSSPCWPPSSLISPSTGTASPRVLGCYPRRTSLTGRFTFAFFLCSSNFNCCFTTHSFTALAERFVTLAYATRQTLKPQVLYIGFDCIGSTPLHHHPLAPCHTAAAPPPVRPPPTPYPRRYLRSGETWILKHILPSSRKPRSSTHSRRWSLLSAVPSGRPSSASTAPLSWGSSASSLPSWRLS